MGIALLKQSHEDLFLIEGYYLAVGFEEGWVVFQIVGRAPTNVKPYRVASSIAAGASTGWDEIKDSESRRYLEPPVKK